MTEALIGTCILAITTVIFVWVCSEYQIYNNEHSAERKTECHAIVGLVCSTEDALLACSG